jgi:hypothetical protein
MSSGVSPWGEKCQIVLCRCVYMLSLRMLCIGNLGVGYPCASYGKFAWQIESTQLPAVEGIPLPRRVSSRITGPAQRCVSTDRAEGRMVGLYVSSERQPTAPAKASGTRRDRGLDPPYCALTTTMGLRSRRCLDARGLAARGVGSMSTREVTNIKERGSGWEVGRQDEEGDQKRL